MVKIRQVASCFMHLLCFTLLKGLLSRSLNFGSNGSVNTMFTILLLFFAIRGAFLALRENNLKQIKRLNGEGYKTSFYEIRLSV